MKDEAVNKASWTPKALPKIAIEGRNT